MEVDTNGGRGSGSSRGDGGELGRSLGDKAVGERERKEEEEEVSSS